MDKMRIIVFQQNDSGKEKIRGVRKYGHHIDLVRVVSIDTALPALIDEPEEYIRLDVEVDLVLDYLRHPDLSDYLIKICHDHGIPIIASGKKHLQAICPFTCCGLGHHQSTGVYGEQFGLPEIEITLENGRISTVTVRRGAPCGATQEAADRIIGLTPTEAMASFAREVQYLCKADPSNFDPVSGKSQLHYAGNVHANALRRCLP